MKRNANTFTRTFGHFGIFTMTIIHIVLFEWKSTSSPDQIEDVRCQVIHKVTIVILSNERRRRVSAC
jgi:hypothetical protein